MTRKRPYDSYYYQTAKEEIEEARNQLPTKRRKGHPWANNQRKTEEVINRYAALLNSSQAQLYPTDILFILNEPYIAEHVRELSDQDLNNWQQKISVLTDLVKLIEDSTLGWGRDISDYFDYDEPPNHDEFKRGLRFVDTCYRENKLVDDRLFETICIVITILVLLTGVVALNHSLFGEGNSANYERNQKILLSLYPILIVAPYLLSSKYSITKLNTR